jgi:hypothetical protein
LEFIPSLPDHMCMTTNDTTISLRNAVPADASALDRLAQLDSRRLPAGPHLVAERDGVLVAALAEPSGIAVSDPFTPTADAIDLLRRWAAERTALPPRRLALRRARLAAAS